MFKGNPYQCITWLSKQDPNKSFEVKEAKRKRSLTQNAYYWAMLNKLARKLRLSDSEVHLNMLRDYGQCDVLSLSMQVEIEDYFKYFDVIGVDYVDGEERRIVKVYKGSSRMNSSEFTQLIQGMRDECESQGIDVMTPEEIARMRFIESERFNNEY